MQNTVCADEDGDGYSGFGKTCPHGQDCDDADPEVGNECFHCTEPSEGCPCEPGQLPLECDLPETIDPETGEKLCPEGTRFCQEGKWTKCIALADVSWSSETGQ